MRRNETRYKGVWSAGYSEAMQDAARALREFVSAGGHFSYDSGGAWDRNSLALKLGNRIVIPDQRALIVGMEYLVAHQKVRDE